MADLKVDNLSPKQEASILALINEPTVRKAAEMAGVGERTLYHWLDKPEFVAAYRKARKRSFNHALAICQRYVPVAIQALAKITVDETAPHSARVSAAASLLKFGRDSIELDDLQERVVVLEGQLGERKQVVNEAR